LKENKTPLVPEHIYRGVGCGANILLFIKLTQVMKKSTSNPSNFSKFLRPVGDRIDRKEGY